MEGIKDTRTIGYKSEPKPLGHLIDEWKQEVITN